MYDEPHSVVLQPGSRACVCGLPDTDPLHRPAVLAPRPLTAEDSDLIDRIDTWCDDYDTTHPVVARELLYETWHRVEELQAEVASLRTRLAATTTTLRTVLGTDEDWQIEPWPEEYEGNKASLRRTCVCDLSDVLKGQGHCWCCDTVNLTADEAAVLDAIRDNDDV